MVSGKVSRDFTFVLAGQLRHTIRQGSIIPHSTKLRSSRNQISICFSSVNLVAKNSPHLTYIIDVPDIVLYSVMTGEMENTGNISGAFCKINCLGVSGGRTLIEKYSCPSTVCLKLPSFRVLGPTDGWGRGWDSLSD